ncbi:invasion protein IalB [Gellertiella hungarica]|uniref:Invasion protein IalB n=2 Tax=Gellertiella hungarica TaxID=1572859 RepID=A0A7W6J4T3_9HYPH|nr:invasion protein IalB [Gellertiella hungarica]
MPETAATLATGFQETDIVMIFKANRTLKTALSALAVATAAASAPSFALAQSAQPAAGGEPLGWYKTCAKQEDNDICAVQNIQRANNGQMITAVGLISVTGKVNRKIMQVSVPSARLIPPGIVMQIDGGKGNKLDYVVCLPDRCTAEVPLTDGMLSSIRKGNEMVLTSMNFRRQPNPIKISLQGFSGVYDGEPISESKLAETQRSLEEGLQKKAEEARKKLEEAQKKATQAQ